MVVRTRLNNVATDKARDMRAWWIGLLFGVLTMDRRESMVSRPHAVVLGLLAAGTQFWALFLLLLRYTNGSSVILFNLSRTAGWWWPGAPIGPNTVWVIGTVSFAAAIAFAFLLTREEPDQKPALES